MAEMFYRVRAGGAPGARTEPVPGPVDLGAGEIVRRMTHTPRREVRGVMVVQVQRSIRMQYDSSPAIAVEERRLDPWTIPVVAPPPKWCRDYLHGPDPAHVVDEFSGDTSYYRDVPGGRGVRFVGTFAEQFRQEYECEYLSREDIDD